MKKIMLALVWAASTSVLGCDDSIPAPQADGGASTDASAPDFSSGTALDVEVDATAKTYVRLDPPSIVAADRAASSDWDLAFTGYNVYTNSGPSGPGAGAAFGPLDASTFLLDEAPTGLPFLAADKTGGAFLGWYFYDGNTHYLWSRLHTFGVKDGERLWKVQVVTYYGERNGGPVSALYKVRYAELTDAGVGPVQSLLLDGTAGGTSAPPTAKSGCVDLGTGEQSSLTITEAAASSAWHLCARRDTISVNGGVSGPRGAESADLDESKLATETLDEVKKRTEASETAIFEAVTKASFASSKFLPDGIVSAFRNLWVDRASAPPTRGTGAWLVRSARNDDQYLVAFPSFEGATALTPTKITVRIKKVGGSAQ